MIEDELGYTGVIQAIYEVNFRVFKQVFLSFSHRITNI